MTPEQLLEKCKELAYVESWNPYLAEFDKRMRQIDKKTVKEFAEILNLYKSRFIEQSMKIFPVGIDEQNYRNGVVIETWKLIEAIADYAKEKPDPVFRDHGEIRSKLVS